MAVGLPALTYVLEEGQRKDWFGSQIIVEATILAVVGICAFISPRADDGGHSSTCAC